MESFYEPIITGPDHVIQDPILLQHFYIGLSKDSRESLDTASIGAFLHLSTSEARAMLDRISGKIPYTSIDNELLEEENESSPKQEEEVLIVISQPLQSHSLAINPEPSIPQNLNPPKKEKIPPFKNPFETKNDLFMLILGKA